MPLHPRVLVGLLAGLFGLVGSLSGCRGAEPEQVVAGHHELCCKAADPDNIGFVGCRASASCRASERVWVRGPITCEPADPQRCAGGRCCKLDLEAIATLEIDRTQVVGGPDQAAVAPEPEPAPTPEPAPIVPVPLDWRARPTPLTIPKLVCDVAGSVELAIEVDAGGRVTAAEIRRGIDPQCDALARDALLHAEFEPARTPDGHAIASSLIFVYDFSRDAGDG